MSSMLESRLIEIYEKRLESFTETVEIIHDSVQNDEAIKLLQDPTLIRYRIDRVNQIVREVIKSQRERLLIAALVRCQQLQSALKEREKQRDQADSRRVHVRSYSNTHGRDDNRSNVSDHNEYSYRQIAETNVYEKQKLAKELRMLRQQYEESEKSVNYLSITVADFKKKERKIIEQNDEGQSVKSLEDKNKTIRSSEADLKREVQEQRIKHERQLQLVQDELQARKSELQASKAELQMSKTELQASKVELHSKNTKNQDLAQKCNNLELELTKVRKLHHANTLQFEASSANSRVQKIESLKRQVKTLTSQLSEIEAAFSLIKDMIFRDVLADIKVLGKTMVSFRQYVSIELEKMKKKLESDLKEEVRQVETKLARKHQKQERLITKVNQIDNELTYFIQKHIHA